MKDEKWITNMIENFDVFLSGEEQRNARMIVYLGIKIYTFKNIKVCSDITSIINSVNNKFLNTIKLLLSENIYELFFSLYILCFYYFNKYEAATIEMEREHLDNMREILLSE